MSFAVALGAFAVTALGIEMYRWWRSPSVGPDGARPMPSVLLPGVCVCLVLFAMAISWQQVRHASHGATDGRTVTVAAVQGNVPRLGLDFNAQRRAVLDYHVKETVLLAQDVKAGKAPPRSSWCGPRIPRTSIPSETPTRPRPSTRRRKPSGCRFLWVACCGTRIPPRTTEVDQLDHRVGPEHRPRRAS